MDLQDGGHDSDSESESSHVDIDELEQALYSQVYHEPNTNHLQLSTDIHALLYMVDENIKTNSSERTFVKPAPLKSGDKHDSVSKKVYNANSHQGSVFSKTEPSKWPHFTTESDNEELPGSSLGAEDNPIVLNSDVTASDSNDFIVLDNIDGEESEDDEMIVLDNTLDSDDSEVENMEINAHHQTKSKHLDASSMSIEEMYDALPDSGWEIEDDDKYDNKDVAYTTKGRYYGKINVRCHNCNEKGHLSKSCPQPKKDNVCILCGLTKHVARNCPHVLCHNCKHPGHKAIECTVSKRSNQYECYRCNMLGHGQQDCTDVWRQYHITTSFNGYIRGSKTKKKHSKYCYNCAKKGHWGYECNKDMMERWKYPTLGKISRYDKCPSMNNGNRTNAKRKRDKNNTEENFIIHNKKNRNSNKRKKHKVKKTFEQDNAGDFPRPKSRKIASVVSQICGNVKHLKTLRQERKERKQQTK